MENWDSAAFKPKDQHLLSKVSQKSLSHTFFTGFHSLARVSVCIAWPFKSLMRKEIMSCLFKWLGQFLLTVQCMWEWIFTWASLFQKFFIGDFFSLMCNATSRKLARKRCLLFCLPLLSSNSGLPTPPPTVDASLCFKQGGWGDTNWLCVSHLEISKGPRDSVRCCPKTVRPNGGFLSCP